ncbi:MAG: HlyD family efflux transporter periplasmic adaptor subunit [Protaetiibacter sp.]
MASLLTRVRTRTWIIVGASVALVLGGTAVYVFGFAIPGARQGAEARSFEVTQQASLQTLESTVAASGTLTPLVNEDVSWEGAGTVLSVDVAEGQTVAVGDTLGTIDTLQLNAELLEAKSTLASAQAKLSDAKSSSGGSAADLASIAAATASVSVAESEVASAQSALDGATLLAPVAGVVTSVGVEVGDTVGSSSSSSSGMGGSPGGSSSTSTSTAAFTIVGSDSWEVSATVGEADVALIAVGNAVHLTTDDGTELQGEVTEVGLLPSTTSGAAEYPVTIAVDGTAKGLFDGVSVDIEIVYESRENVLTVPSAAVTTSDDGASTVTLVGTDGTKTETTVQVGETVGQLTEIVSGLKEGDSVLVTSFTPGEGNSGQMGQFPADGEFPGGGQFPGGGDGSFTPPDGGGQGGFGGRGGNG